MLMTVSFKQEFDNKLFDDSSLDLIDFAKARTNSDVEVYATGIGPLFTEAKLSIAHNYELIEMIVLPVAILILGLRVHSYRHMFVAFLCLVATLLYAFAILVPITDHVAINPFSPSIMMSLGIAISFDYSLFMLCRFREEVCNIALRSADY